MWLEDSVARVGFSGFPVGRWGLGSTDAMGKGVKCELVLEVLMLVVVGSLAVVLDCSGGPEDYESGGFSIRGIANNPGSGLACIVSFRFQESDMTLDVIFDVISGAKIDSIEYDNGPVRREGNRSNEEWLCFLFQLATGMAELNWSSALV